MTRKKPEVTREKLRSIADFSWASVGRYLVYMSAVVGLQEIDSQRVVSFPLSRLGPDKVLKQKEATAKVLESNISALAAFVGERREELGINELSVLRGLYLQYKDNGRTVRGHIEMARHYQRSVAVSLFGCEGEEENDILF